MSFILKEDKWKHKHTTTAKNIIEKINDIEEYNISHIDDIKEQVSIIRANNNYKTSHYEIIEGALQLIEEYILRL